MERFKKDSLEASRKKVADHEERLTKIEANHNELRSTNYTDHQNMVVNIHDNKVSATRNGEQITQIWEQVNKLRDLSAKGTSGSNIDEAQSKQININAVEIATLGKRLNAMDELRSSVRTIEELNASVSELKRSVDQNNTKFITSIHENHVTSSSNAKQIEEVWKAMAKIKESDD
jgi:hypothetical protein